MNVNIYKKEGEVKRIVLLKCSCKFAFSSGQKVKSNHSWLLSLDSMTNRVLSTGGLHEAWLFMLISMLPEMVELAKILDKRNLLGPLNETLVELSVRWFEIRY